MSSSGGRREAHWQSGQSAERRIVPFRVNDAQKVHEDRDRSIGAGVPSVRRTDRQGRVPAAARWPGIRDCQRQKNAPNLVGMAPDPSSALIRRRTRAPDARAAARLARPVSRRPRFPAAGLLSIALPCIKLMSIALWSITGGSLPALADGGSGGATGRQVPSAAGASTAGCQCMSRTGRHDLGALVCLDVGGRLRLMRCVRVLNNTSWEQVEDGCPTASLGGSAAGADLR